MSANIESPGSQTSSKGSKSSFGLEENYFSPQIENHTMMTNIDAGSNPFTNLANIDTNYFTDFYAPDDLDLDEIDEIDTKNMAIYSSAGASSKKDRFFEESSTSAAELLESLETKQSKPSASQPKGKSLLMKSGGKTLPEINIDILKEDESANVAEDVLAQAVDAANISPNSLSAQSIISNYDENSRVCKALL